MIVFSFFFAKSISLFCRQKSENTSQCELYLFHHAIAIPTSELHRIWRERNRTANQNSTQYMLYVATPHARIIAS